MTRLFYRFKEFRNTHLYDSNIFLRNALYLDFLVYNIFYKVPISIKVFFIILSV
ncbi:unnamed protein product, partial [Brassica rapa]